MSKFMKSHDVVAKAMALTIKNGGATLDARTGEPITTGYAVGGIREFKFYIARLEQLEEIEQAVRTIRSYHKNCAIGFWLDGSTLYVDAVNITKYEDAARIVAETFGEIAYFNLDANEEIRVK